MEVLVPRDPRVVDEDVEPVEVPLDLVDDLLPALRVPDVVGTNADGTSEIGLVADIGGDDLRPRLRQSSRDGVADALTPPSRARPAR